MHPRRPFLVLFLVVALPLGGCDAAIAGYFMPGILPGVGRPIRGTVTDANTRLPVGGATITAGLGSTLSDGKGEFNLYGSLGGREISVSRAGYVANTLGGRSLSPDEPVAMIVNPVFNSGVPAPNRFVTLEGAVKGLPVGAPAMVWLGGALGKVDNGLYSVQYGGGIPGRITTSILAWGILSAPYVEGVRATQPFHFESFHYTVESLPLADSIPNSRVVKDLIVAATSPVPIQNVKVAYSNLGNAASVQTDIALDFGVLGYVPVARAASSSQQLPVPTLAGLKYVVTGVASDPSGRSSSSVSLTTNNPGQATFPLLTVPAITGPANGAKGVGQRPTFSWNAVPGEVNYAVTLYEDGAQKWVGVTDTNEITYPGFAANDVNGGALRPAAKYTWSLRVIDLLDETEVPKAGRGFGLLAPVPTRPYRVRQREAEIRDNGFTL